MEEWKDIKGCEGRYQVSNEGRVKSIDRVIITGRGARHYTEHLLSPAVNEDGYFRVFLSIGTNGKWYLIHRLVAEAFIDNPDNLPEINHKDENPANNKVDNIEWCDRNYNINYGTRTSKTSKPIEALDDEGNIVYTFESKKEARRHGFADSNITNCIKGKVEKAYGLKWRNKKEDDN